MLSTSSVRLLFFALSSDLPLGVTVNVILSKSKLIEAWIIGINPNITAPGSCKNMVWSV